MSLVSLALGGPIRMPRPRGRKPLSLENQGRNLYRNNKSNLIIYRNAADEMVGEVTCEHMGLLHF